MIGAALSLAIPRTHLSNAVRVVQRSTLREIDHIALCPPPIERSAQTQQLVFGFKHLHICTQCHPQHKNRSSSRVHSVQPCQRLLFRSLLGLG